MRGLLPAVLLLFPGMAACSLRGNSPPAIVKEEASPFGSSGVPPQLRSRTPDAAGGSAGTSAPVALTPEEEIVFTDPDNPDAPLQGLDTPLSSAKRRGPWESSPSLAKRRSVREGKPLLIWFTNSQSSPTCRQLSAELFSSTDFESWAAEHVVRLKVDANVRVDDANLSMEQSSRLTDRRRDAVQGLRKHFRVSGNPTLVLVTPGGETVGRYRGYTKGDAEFLWGRIKHGESVCVRKHEAWIAGLRSKGYRDWKDRNGKSVFARLVAVSGAQLEFVEPDGTRSRTDVARLSDEDRAWIAEREKQRGM
jgi:hypothetical protein